MSVECYQLKLMTKKMLSAKANDEKNSTLNLHYQCFG
jgi:hypothetical protein